MAVVAIQQRGSTRGPSIQDLIAEDGGATRKVETTDRITLAKRFADQTAIDTFVTARGGVTANLKAMTLPAGIE